MTGIGTEIPRAEQNGAALRLPSVAVIVVSYDSGPVLQWCVESLANQSCRPDAVLIIDNNSPDSSYLQNVPLNSGVTILRNAANEGFCGANNRGFRMLRHHDYIIFLNPDAFMQEPFIEQALKWMERPDNAGVGMLTGTLLGFDIDKKEPTGRMDSTGIFQTTYGKWYDRDQGRTWRPERVASSVEEVPAITGALMFCRTAALESVASPDGDVFDKKFFMYKEDIDLSLRLRKRGWKLVYSPSLLSYHCRGWRGRRQMSSRARHMSAKNELRICLRNGGKGIIYSALKWLLVPLEDYYIKAVKTFTRS